MPTPSQSGLDLLGEAVRFAGEGCAMPAERLEALSLALGSTPGELRAVFRVLKGPDPNLALPGDAARLIGALLPHAPKAVRARLLDSLAVPEQTRSLLRLWLSDRASSAPGPPNRPAALGELERAYKGRDWLAAAASARRLQPARLTPTNLQRLVEAFAALGRWQAVLRACAHNADPSRAGRFALARARALLGLGQFEEVWRFVQDVPASERHPHLAPIAAAAIRCLDRPEDIPVLLTLGGGTAWSERTLAPVFEDIVRRHGKVLARRVLRASARANPLTPETRLAIRRLRLRLTALGWSTQLEARWARFVRERVLRGRAGADEGVVALIEALRPRDAFSLLRDLGFVGATPETLQRLAQQLAERGAVAEPEELLAIAGVEDPEIASYCAFVRGLAKAALPHGTRRPGTRLLFAHLQPVPAHREPGPVLVHLANGFSVGGTERQLQTVALGLARRYPRLRQVFVLFGHAASGRFDKPLKEYPGWEERFRFLMPEGLDREWPKGGAPPDMAGLPALAAKAARLPRVGRMRELLQDMRPGAVMAWKADSASLVAAALADVPRILVRAASMPPALRPWPTEWQLEAADFGQEAYRFLAPREGVRFVANSSEALAAFRRIMGWPAERSGLLRNALDTKMFNAPFSRAEARRRLRLPAHKTIVAGCFRLSIEKGPGRWLDVATTLLRQPAGEDLHFVLAGGGPLFANLAANIERRGLTDRIQLLGEVTGEVAEVYRAADLLLHTALVEGLPNALIEAQWNALPVVAVDVGGVAEAFLPGVTGELVQPNAGVAGLAEAVLRVRAALPDMRARPSVFRDFVLERFGLEQRIEEIALLLGLDAV